MDIADGGDKGHPRRFGSMAAGLQRRERRAAVGTVGGFGNSGAQSCRYRRSSTGSRPTLFARREAAIHQPHPATEINLVRAMTSSPGVVDEGCVPVRGLRSPLKSPSCELRRRGKWHSARSGQWVRGGRDLRRRTAIVLAIGVGDLSVALVAVLAVRTET